MAVFYAVEQGAFITKEGERLLVKKESKLLKAIHIHDIDQVVIFGRISMTPAVIQTLLKRGIETAFLSKNGNYLGRLCPPLGKNVSLRIEHFKRSLDDSFSISVAKEMLKGKIENQRTFLRRINRKGIGIDEEILLLKIVPKEIDKQDSQEGLMGVEGNAQRIYFQALKKAFGDEIKFEGRERRPPKDPVNSLLSLGYTLLFNAVFSAISMCGLDPYLGFLHSKEYGKPSLALDLMEEWRPIIVDPVVLSCFNLKILKENDFTIDPSEGGFYLKKDALRKFITQFERKMADKVIYPNGKKRISYRSCIEEQVRLLVRAIKGETTYKAAIFR